MHKNDFTLAELPGALRRVFLMWRSSDRGDGVRLRDIDLAELSSDLDDIVLTEIHRDAATGTIDFEPVFLGKSVRDRTARPMIGKRLSTLPGKGPGSRTWAAYEALAMGHGPLLARLPYDGPAAGIAATNEVLLPLRPDEGTARAPRYALAGVRYVDAEDACVAEPATVGAASRRVP
ncbi:hypothetical protein [Ponticoccus alexandrii]|uniref:PAS domain-containing protein n=1 Tax=Ponticoccus alexandrii TaxID=1943633 RepID=A0ABX7F648_9RHOB|nr:hypothetical protein [Ponticoccus alexandrii]ETA53745.1 hypothetical protein P279_01595 [Rhodobacteraceae bacterium PD-2]QRF65049.1 hypothetical protein GQA70_01180 [Ponticoccus alexandrii]